MNSPRHRTSTVGWVGLLAYIIAWDLTAPEGEMLTHGFRRVKYHPVVLIGLALTTAHLFEWLPEKADPFHSIRVVREHTRNRNGG